MFLFHLRKDQNVVQVHYYNPLSYEGSKDVVWKVVELLVIPKNIMRGSKRPQLVQEAAFHSFPGLMCTLLEPQQTSSFVKYQTPQS